MSKITNDGLTRSGTGCSIAVPIWQQWASKGERRNTCLRRSFQACGHITRLLATTKHHGVVYHVLEPIQCSLRHHLSASRATLSSLRRLLLQLLCGLDYLHDRGWVHFDLSLDSVAVRQLGFVYTPCLKKQAKLFLSELRQSSTNCDMGYINFPPHLTHVTALPC